MQRWCQQPQDVVPVATRCGASTSRHTDDTSGLPHMHCIVYCQVPLISVSSHLWLIPQWIAYCGMAFQVYIVYYNTGKVTLVCKGKIYAHFSAFTCIHKLPLIFYGLLPGCTASMCEMLHLPHKAIHVLWSQVPWTAFTNGFIMTTVFYSLAMCHRLGLTSLEVHSE